MFYVVNLYLLVLEVLTGASVATEPKVVRMPFARRNIDHLSKRQYISSLANDLFPGGGYYITAEVGTPGQKVQLQLDTGSSDVWVFGPSTECSPTECDGGTFDSSQSSTFQSIQPGGFGIQYGSGKVIGDTISDTFAFAGITLSSLQMAIATQADTEPTGIMGIGYDTNEATISAGGSQYPSVVDQMVSQGWIQTRAYSLYLDDLEASSGEVIFGGFDSGKFQGTLTPLPVLSDNGGGFAQLAVPLSEVIFVFQDQTTQVLSSGPVPAILDSGTSLMQFPPDVFEALAEITRISYDQDDEIYLIDCGNSAYQGGLVFQFGGDNGPTIAVPLEELVLQQIGTANGVPQCVFGATPTPGGNNPAILGDTFLRSAYVLYDLDSNIIAIAQTVFNSDQSNLFGLGPDSTGIDPVSASPGGGGTPSASSPSTSRSQSQPLPSPSETILTPSPSSPPSVTVGPPGPHPSATGTPISSTPALPSTSTEVSPSSSPTESTPTETLSPAPIQSSTPTLPTTLTAPTASFVGPNPIPPTTLTAIPSSAAATGGGITESGSGGSTITSVLFVTPSGSAGASAGASGTTTVGQSAATQSVGSGAARRHVEISELNSLAALFMGWFFAHAHILL
ncbi:MAG: hypothetical protein MMC33_007553 [Icmadophila ericetorum]|nr:hypothetical protein [Icmadophila ericetorum]